MGRKIGSHNKHKKEKPVKEKKKRGRPTKQSQHQKQNQVVNVTINSDGGDNDKKKKNKFQDAIQSIPNMIFNPSLSIPQGYPITRPDTNPPLYDISNLIPDYNNRLNQPQPTPPIRPVDVQPTQPNPTPNQPIKPIDIQPNQPNQPTPTRNPQPIQLNPQTDQSHPIPTELMIDSNISNPIHNKHTQHKQAVQEIKPQVPTNTKKTKFNDMEGLGVKIPIQNIGAIAGTIASGGAYGAAVAAGEALVTGGLTGLAASGESIFGATIGGGIASGVNSALGGTGEAGHIISGIAGGIAGRTAVTRTRTRVRPRNTEIEPLVGRGNRLGGPQNGESRLTANIQEEITQAPGEITQSRNPFTLAKKNLKFVKEQISKPYTPSETIAKARPPGTSTTDYNKQQFPPVPQLHEPIQRENILTHEDIIYKDFQQEQKQLQRKYLEDIKGGHTNPDIATLRDLTESGAHWESNPLSRSKKVILARENEPNTKMMDNIKQIIREEDGIRAEAANKIKAAVKRNENKNGIQSVKSILNKRIAARKTEIQDELKDIFETDNKVKNAATKIQSVVKGHKARNIIKMQKESNAAIEQIKLEDNAVNTLKNAIRTKIINKKVSGIILKARERKAANILQGAVKGHQARKEAINNLIDKSEKTQATITLQNALKGHQARKELGNKINTMTRQKQIKNMQNEIMAQGAVNDMVDNAVNQSAARTIQTATRGYNARNELGNRINAAEQTQAKNTLSSAIKSRKARQELTTKQQQFNPIDYQDALRANKKTYQNQILDYTTRRPQPIKETQAKKLKYATKRVNSISKLTEKRKQPGRPPGRPPAPNI